jgi:hypothetical protein
MVAFLLFLMAFGLGMVPFGLYVARFVKGIDPRDAGSRNVGATNVARLCGTPWGVLTLALDLLKGFIPCALAVGAETGWLALLFIGAAAILGHAYSPMLNFRGGKAVATTVGVFLALAPVALILAAICTLGSSGFRATSRWARSRSPSPCPSSAAHGQHRHDSAGPGGDAVPVLAAQGEHLRLDRAKKCRGGRGRRKRGRDERT